MELVAKYNWKIWLVLALWTGGPEIQMIADSIDCPTTLSLSMACPSSLSPLKLLFSICFGFRHVLPIRHQDESQKLEATRFFYSRGRVLFLTILRENSIKYSYVLLILFGMTTCLMISQSGISCFSQRSKLGIITVRHCDHSPYLKN